MLKYRSAGVDPAGPSKREIAENVVCRSTTNTSRTRAFPTIAAPVPAKGGVAKPSRWNEVVAFGTIAIVVVGACLMAMMGAISIWERFN